jgi:hypothetical protein
VKNDIKHSIITSRVFYALYTCVCACFCNCSEVQDLEIEHGVFATSVTLADGSSFVITPSVNIMDGLDSFMLFRKSLQQTMRRCIGLAVEACVTISLLINNRCDELCLSHEQSACGMFYSSGLMRAKVVCRNGKMRIRGLQ